MKRLLLVLCLAVALPAHAFTPESGWWWNPAENGRGFNIEIQDDVAVISAYVYDPAGRPVWFLAVGTLQGYGFATPQPFVKTQLDRFENGQCITCPYEGTPDWIEGAAGRFRIDFTSRTTATITWRDGSTTPIRRHQFLGYNERQRMVGEWQMVVDFSSQNGGDAFWSGDALVFDRVLTDDIGPYYAGARKHSRADRTGDDGETGDAAGDYIKPSTSVPGSPGVHTIVVDNSSDPDQRWLAYYITVGTNGFNGIAEIYCDGCSATGQGVPVRGWRSASRTFVETGRGPAKAGAAGPGGAEKALRLPDALSAGFERARLKSVETLTGDPKAASRAIEAAHRLTDELRRTR